HQKGVIHRDLKPSNILVSVQGERAVPKIIDFGLARAVERDGEPSYATIDGQLVGTPGYMSPEQAAGDGAALDTRTDVYSLGVVLYELLVGSLPVDPCRPQALDARDPARPSTRLSQMGQAASDVAARRSTEPRELARALRGDLDQITLAALEPERTRRYRGVGELADDLRRHLADEPVLAAAAGRAYRFRKFVRRNRVAVGTGVLVLAALVAGL